MLICVVFCFKFATSNSDLWYQDSNFRKIRKKQLCERVICLNSMCDFNKGKIFLKKTWIWMWLDIFTEQSQKRKLLFKRHVCMTFTGNSLRHIDKNALGEPD